MTEKYCVNCANYMYVTRPVGEGVGNHICHRLLSEKINLVTGIDETSFADTICEQERDDFSELSCGEEGQFFRLRDDIALRTDLIDRQR